MKTRASVNLALKVIGTAGLAGITIVAPNALQGLEKLLKSSAPRSANHQIILRELKRQGLVHILADDGSLHYTITPAGIHRLQKVIIDEIEIKMPKKWDKKWRIVSFDIPVKQTRQRASFVSRLQNLDFMMIQKSIWAHPAPCFEIIEQIAGYYNLNRYCVFFEVEKVDELTAHKLTRHFARFILP